MRGRKPKPTALHEISGTLHTTRHRARQLEPKAEGDLGAEPPDWMTPTQQASWRFAMEHAPRGVLKRIDRGVLAVWVEAEDRHRVATIQQGVLDRDNKMPLLVRNKDAPPSASPYLNILTKAALVMIKAASELGFSPASRPRLSTDTPVPTDASPWANLRVINGGKPRR